MGNVYCPAAETAHLASVARDICPFPNYTPNPLFFNMLSVNSSLHLRNHYMAVQSSLTPKQLEDFTQSLRTTFGKEGKVTLGGVGVVALSLAVLFDTLARQVRGEWVSDSGPIPGLFVKDLRGYNPPYVNTVSDYLRLVPYIANNPIRMKEEAERYFKQLLIHKQTMEENENQSIDDITGVNIMLGKLFLNRLKIHLLRITNSTVVANVVKSVKALKKIKGNPVLRESTTETGDDIIVSLNCDPEAATKDFLAEVQKSNVTQAAFKQCQPINGYIPKTWLHFIARIVWQDVHDRIRDHTENKRGLLLAQREDLDLKASALRVWAE